MKNFIRNFLKSVGVQLILNELEVESYISYYRIDFKDRFGNYVIFDVFHNGTDVFVDNSIKLLGDGKDYSLSDSLRSRFTIVGGLKDYMANKYPVPSKKQLDEYFEEQMEFLVSELYELDIPDFSIRKVEFFSSPSLMVFIHLNYCKKRVKPMKIFIGEEIHYSLESVDCELLVKKVKEVLYV